jgi:hypothetical protein
MLFDFTTQDAMAFTKKSGTISTNDIWTQAGQPYYIIGDVTITSGATLTINPGVTVSFNNTATSIIVDNGRLLAIGSKAQPIIFDHDAGAQNMIDVRQNGRAVLDWCTFGNASIAIKLMNNEYGVRVANCTFKSSCTTYFDLILSKVNVTSSNFNFEQYDNSSTLPANLGKTTLDGTSEIYIQYYVNVDTVDGNLNPVSDVTVSVSDSPLRNSIQGISDSVGQFWYSPATAARISGISPAAFFQYQNTLTVTDKWESTGFKEPGISTNTTTINNASSAMKTSDLYIPYSFTFKYPPRIDDTNPSSVVVNEDERKSITFNLHDNDDLNGGFNNLTINITDQNGKGIFNDTGSPNTEDKWVYWMDNKLIFYRTIESPRSPAKPDDFDAIVNEDIFIRITDPFGQEDSFGPIDVEFHNVPDKPVIDDLPSSTAITVVKQDTLRILNITVTDNDNETVQIVVWSSSDYIKYNYTSPTNQKLELNFPNEFGDNNTQELVYVNATDHCSDPVSYSFLVKFIQTPDPPKIVGEIPSKWGFEDSWEPDMSLGPYASDPDPDDSASTLKWYVTGLDKKVFGKQLFEVSNENATADAPLSFNLNPVLDLGGARDLEKPPVEEKIQIWLMDKDGLRTSQDVSLFINITNQPPSLHKIDKGGKKVTVDPESGLTSDVYKFMVEYKDQDGEKGDAPEFVKLYLDGNEYDMLEEDTSDTNYKDGKLYYYEASMLDDSPHEHYFACSDSDLTTQLPLIDSIPNNISGPDVTANIYILRKESTDGNFIVRLAHMSMNPTANIADATKPLVGHEPDKDEINKTRGDIGIYFNIETLRIDSLLWVEITAKFGPNWDNYNTTWLRKNDLQVAYFTATTNDWVYLSFSTVDLKMHTLKCNLSTDTGQEAFLDEILTASTKPIFTIAGILDADGDGYYNPKDAFPFDPAARDDRDNDGSPGKNEWVQGKSAKDSTTGLHQDEFPEDPAASKDGDDDKCPDEWNEGRSEEDSTSVPKLVLDSFPNNPGACADTDGDGWPDILIPDRNTQPELVEDSDDDNDGMPDWWEEQWLEYAKEHDISHLFDPKNDTDANKDWDNDGRDNFEEYRKDSNPFEKDEDDSIISGLGENPIILMFIIVIIVIIIIGVIFILRKRGKKEPEEMPRGMGGPIPEPGPESGEGELPPESRVDAPMRLESEEPPAVLPSEAEQYQAEPTPTDMGMDTGIAPGPGPESEGEVPPPEETTMDTTTAPVPTPEGEAVPAPDTEPMAAPETTDTGTESTEPQEPTEPAPQPETFSCPNCGSALTRDMTQCPGCAAPLVFD